MKKWEKPTIQELELSYTAESKPIELDPNKKWVCENCCTQVDSQNHPKYCEVCKHTSFKNVNHYIQGNGDYICTIS